MNYKKKVGPFRLIDLVLIVLAVLSILLSVWYFLIVILWAGYFYGWPTQLRSLKKLHGSKVVIGFVALTVVLFVMSSGSSSNSSNTDDSSSSSSKSETINLTNADSSISGIIKTDPRNDGRVRAEYVLVITDPSIVNNGTCIDGGEPYCTDDEEGKRNDIARIKYHYGVFFKNTEDMDDVVGGHLAPVYCNKDAVLADLSQFIEKEYSERTNYICNGTFTATWKPADTFIVIGSGVFESMEQLNSVSELSLYDVHSTYSFSATSTETSLSVTERNSLSYNEYINQPYVKSYQFKMDK